MQKEHLKYLVCPACRRDLELANIINQHNNRIETGELTCNQCERTYPVIHYIPRFVSLDNYASSFGFEWLQHAKTQYDSYSGVSISETRFFEETKWPRNLKGQLMLEVGSGSGRFTEHAASTGAMVISMDLSQAVEANYASNGHLDNVLIVQASLYEMPFRNGSFDKLLCIGILQHTPDVKKAFMSLPIYLKSGGCLVVDVYRKWPGLKGLFQTRRWVRPLVKNVPPHRLYGWCVQYIRLMWPVVTLLAKIPVLGKRLVWVLLVPYYSQYNLPQEVLKEWAILDLFDILSAKYEYPQTLETVQQWFSEANLCQVEVTYGYNGIEGRGIKP